MTNSNIPPALGLLSLDEMQKALPSSFRCGVDSSTLIDKSMDTKPACPPGTSEHFSMFENMRTALVTKLTGSLPSLSQENDFWDALKEIVDADQAKSESVQKRDGLSKQKPVDPDALNLANQAAAHAEEELKKKTEEAAIVASNVLNRADIQNLLSDAYDDSDLLTFIILKEFTPQKMAQWCDQHPDQASQLLAFLKDENLMRTFLQSGGARNGEYGRAVEIYHQINPNPSNSVLQRLRLAIALELCSPYPMFDNPHSFVNPLQRYIHYEKAYLLGELDANFSQFNVWEMRQIVNSDTTEEELEWGRQSLMNYRPDLIKSDSPQWRYCLVVKTDVAYAVPDWYKSPKTFDQILSGGGKCGPRAWYGRFICKAFGIPTWGVKQPGHAAMTRWTTNGWCTCLGAGFQFSHWEGEGGLNFLLSTQAMRASGSEAEYLKKVRRLEWVASFCNEDRKFVAQYLPSCNSMWWSLSFFQRKVMAAGASGADVFMHPREDVSSNLQDQIKARPLVIDPIEWDESAGTIVIPANACTAPPKATNKVFFFRSFVGGHQLFIKDNGTVDYTLNTPMINETVKKYHLICRVCTVHRKSKPLALFVCTDGKLSKPFSIELPYTLGMWRETNPVEIELGGPGVKASVLRFVRENEPYGFSLKEIKLVPVSQSNQQDSEPEIAVVAF